MDMEKVTEKNRENVREGAVEKRFIQSYQNLILQKKVIKVIKRR